MPWKSRSFTLRNKRSQQAQNGGKPQVLVTGIIGAEHHIVDPGVPVHLGRSPQNGTVISGGCQIKVTSF